QRHPPRGRKQLAAQSRRRQPRRRTVSHRRDRLTPARGSDFSRLSVMALLLYPLLPLGRRGNERSECSEEGSRARLSACRGLLPHYAHLRASRSASLPLPRRRGRGKSFLAQGGSVALVFVPFRRRSRLRGAE